MALIIFKRGRDLGWLTNVDTGSTIYAIRIGRGVNERVHLVTVKTLSQMEFSR